MIKFLSKQSHQYDLDEYTEHESNFTHIIPWIDNIYAVGMDDNNVIPVERDASVGSVACIFPVMVVN